MCFHNLRGSLIDELNAEHSQRIASRELADEFTGLIGELELDKQLAMIGSCSAGLSYINSHQAAFNEFADTTRH